METTTSRQIQAWNVKTLEMASRRVFNRWQNETSCIEKCFSLFKICKISISKRVEKTHNPPVPSLLPWLPCHNLSLASSVKLKTHSYWSTDQTPLFVLVCLGVGNNQSKDRCWDVSICRNWKSGTKVWLYPPVRGKNVPIIVFFFFSNQVSLFLPKSTCGGNIPVWNGAMTLKLVNGTKSHDFQ